MPAEAGIQGREGMDTGFRRYDETLVPSRRPNPTCTSIFARVFANKTLGGLRVFAARGPDLQTRSCMSVGFHMPVRDGVFFFFERQHGKVGRDQPADAESGRQTEDRAGEYFEKIAAG